MARQPDLVYAGAPRVNLMPRSETDRREREALTRKWMWGVLGAVVVALLFIGATYAMTVLADQRYAAAQAETNNLTTQLAGLSGINQALASQRELTQFRAEAMGADFAWAPVIDEVTGALPPGVTITGFAVTSGGNPVPGTKPEDAVGLTGTFTFTSHTPLDMGPTIQSIRASKGVMDADGKALTSGGTTAATYTYLLTVTFNQTIYSGQYAAKGAQ